MSLDLDAIRERAEFVATFGHASGDARIYTVAALDIPALIAGVERLRAALAVLRDYPANLDDEGWKRLADRAEAAGYDRRVVTRYRNGKTWATTNIEAAYQQGWRDARAAAKRALGGAS